jgi:hypothetical protein
MKKYFGKMIVAGISIFVFGIMSVNANFSLPEWPYYSNLEKGGSVGMIKVVLPKDVSWQTDDLYDLRVVDENGIEVPYVYTKNIKPSVPVVNAIILNSVIATGGSTKQIIDTQKSGVIKNSINLISDQPNFRRQVTLYSSDTLLPVDDARWSLVSNSGFIFSFTDLTSGNRQGKTWINFPANTARYFKVVVSSGEEGPVMIKSATIDGELDVSLLKYSQEFSADVFNSPNKKTTEIIIDLGINGKFSDSIALNVKDSNYLRKVIVETSNSSSTESSWRYLNQGSISSISTSLFKGSSNTVYYPEQRARYIKLSIVNDDNQPLSVANTVTVAGPIFEIVFDAEANSNYKIFYGSTSAKRPQYDISRFASYIEVAKLPSIPTGQILANSSYIAPKPPTVPFTESNKWLLNTVLVLVVIAIAIAIAIYLKKYLVKQKDADSGNFIKEDQTPQNPLQ